MKRLRRQQGKGIFDLVEEATHLLRTAPAATLAAYYVGTIPFILGLLYFWADMSRSPFANRHLVDAALGVGMLFLWMKFWQSVFAQRLRAQIAVQIPPQLNTRNIAHLLLTQTILQPLGLFLIPLALVPVIPFAWVFASFQNMTVLANAEDGGASKLFKKSWKQAMLWPGQNHFALAILLVFAFCVFLNWASFCFILPGLFKMLLGVESVFSKSPRAMLNTTFFAGMFGLTYLCADPILKTTYVLRCFYGEALQTGEDLKAELKTFAMTPKTLTVVLLFFQIFLWVAPAKAENGAAPVASPASEKISAADLDHAIVQTIQEPKYTWRMPRGKIVESESDEGVITKFFHKTGSLLRKWARAVRDWIDKWWDKLFNHKSKDSTEKDSSGYGWMMAAEILLYGLATVVLVALIIFLFRIWMGRKKTSVTVAETILSVPDIADENIRADQLPEDGWMKLARELMERGEFRLAMRALYLASLAHLAAQNLISIARFKSNRDYERELNRRAHSFQNLLLAFGDNILVFERIWYGRHEVNGELVNQFAANVEKIKTAG